MAAYVATSAEAYERSMGRWSAMLAEAVLDALDLAPGGAVLDAGCGTGALSAAIAARGGTARITGVDLSEAFLAAARARVPGGRFIAGDVTRLGLPNDAFDAAV
jgi:ubiquinone/menaquinone biosynthesis C-methylase UbiE